jgi:hypothetical protein
MRHTVTATVILTPWPLRCTIMSEVPVARPQRNGKWVSGAMARMGFRRFAELQTTNQLLVLEAHSVSGVANSQVVWIRELPLRVS